MTFLAMASTSRLIEGSAEAGGIALGLEDFDNIAHFSG